MADAFDINLIKTRFSKSLLYVLPFIEGGTSRHTHEMLERLAKEKVSVILLCYDNNGYVRLQHNIIEEAKDIFYSPAALENMLNDLEKLGILHVHYQHTVNAPRQIERVAHRLGCTYDVTLHDYYYLCPTISYTNNDEKYDGDKTGEEIDEYLKEGRVLELYKGDFYKDYRSVQQFRDYNEEFLNEARAVFCPSKDTLKRYKKHFKNVNYIYKPHIFNPQLKDLSNKKRLKHENINVGIIGGINQVKGSHLIDECAKAVSYHDLPVRFKIIGYTDIDDKIADYYNINITGKYEDKELENLIEQAKIDIFFLPSQWPETYSYTLSHAFHYGLYPVVFDIGAPAERVKKAKFGDVISFASSPDKIVKHFVKVADKAAKKKREIVSVDYSNFIKQYYEF